MCRKPHLKTIKNDEAVAFQSGVIEIQRRLGKSIEKNEETREKAFLRLICKVKIKVVHQLNEEIKSTLQDKHPSSRVVNPNIILPPNVTPGGDILRNNG